MWTHEGYVKTMRIKSILAVPLLLAALPVWPQDAPIIRDAEYKILEVQNGEAWASDDQEIASKLAELREKNGGKPPNIVYILLDDVGFGEISMDELSVIRGYKTPNMTAMANDGLSMMRMYTEPSCTPTRVAMMTGRYPIRTGTTEAKATLAGDGLAGDEVTIAEGSDAVGGRVAAKELVGPGVADINHLFRCKAELLFIDGLQQW